MSKLPVVWNQRLTFGVSLNSEVEVDSMEMAFRFGGAVALLPPVAITAVPDGKLHAPYFMEWSLGLEHELGTTGSIHAQYVGTRAENQPYLTQVNGYQTVCEGCFAPFPYAQSTDPRFGAVTQFPTGAMAPGVVDLSH
jgi:hypothetical protein